MKSVERVDSRMFSSAAQAALDMVALEQARRRGAAQHAIELPGQVLGVLQPGIGAARAEGRDLMRGIARENHPAVEEAIHPPALEFVERDPLELELVVTEHARDPRPHVLRLLLDDGIGIAIELEIDAPDIVGLPVQQRGAAGMKRRIEPEPALGRELRRHLDVGDQELVLEHLAGELGADHLPQRGARAVAGDDILRVQAIGALRRLDRQRDGIVAAAQAPSPCCASADRSPADRWMRSTR